MSNANSYFTFNALLEAHHIDLKDVKYYCHTTNDNNNKNLSLYELFMNERKKFDVEQQNQGKKDVYSKPYLASFVQTPNNETVFVGLYEKENCQIDTQENRIYKLNSCTELSEWSGRIFVDYPSGLPVHRLPQEIKNGLPIIQVLKQEQSLEFPGFHNFIWATSKLNIIPTDWKNTLKNMKGVYLLTCRNHHKLYVGSAYGENGFLGRWQNGYADGEGGGNKELINFLKSHPDADFHISILEIAASTDSVNKIIGNENSWKAKLNTRNLAGNGLNCN